MNQDRRKNGWIFISSLLQIALSVVLLSAGIALGVTGFLYKSKLATIKELQFFVNQEGMIKAQQFISGSKAVFKKEFLYLMLGSILAIIGLLLLILAIVSLICAQKRSVVRHKIKLMFFAFIPLIIVGCATTYLLFEGEVLPDIIKYILYGIIGGFGACVIFTSLGIMFGRSEQFMSNDNNKYAFDNSSLRNARAHVNNNMRSAETNMAQPYQQQAMPNVQQAQRVATGQPIRSTSAIARPVQPMHTSPNNQVRPAQPMPNQARPVQSMRGAINPQARPQGQQPMRPTQQRPVGQTQPNMQQRPVGQAQSNVQGARPMPRPQQPVRVRTCPKCGKQLAPQEKFCVRCGYKVV